MIRGEPLYDPKPRQPGAVGSLVRGAILLSGVAYAANLLLTFHARWTAHSLALAQYESLAASQVCADPQLRVMSAEVNNCALAERMVRGGSLSPATLALLETLQRLALCAGEIDPTGRVQNRCDAVVESLANASTKILVILICLGCAAIWGMKQYHAVHTIRATRLPLDDAEYPRNAALPPWLKED